MLRRLFLTALLAGLAAGLAVSAVQRARVMPLILAAERYEAVRPGAAPAEAAAPDLLRALRTVAANSLTGVGFGLVLAALLPLAPWPVNTRRGLLWGAAGFAVFALAPALVLPPALPGAREAVLGTRAVLWLTTVAATALGLGLLVLHPRPWGQGLGALALLLPHLVGVHRVGAAGFSGLPAELARHYVAASLGSTAVFWLVLGAVAGSVYPRLR